MSQPENIPKPEEDESTILTREGYIHVLDSLVTIINEHAKGCSYPRVCATEIYNRKEHPEFATLAADELTRLQIETRGEMIPQILTNNTEKVMLMYVGDHLVEIMRLHAILKEIPAVFQGEFHEAFEERIGKMHYVN